MFHVEHSFKFKYLFFITFLISTFFIVIWFNYIIFVALISINI
jgi:hypothetical protein